jgi:hypothetical protein
MRKHNFFLTGCLIFILIISLTACGSTKTTEQQLSEQSTTQEATNTNSNDSTDIESTTNEVRENATKSAISEATVTNDTTSTIPNRLVFKLDSNGSLQEPRLGDFNNFLSRVFVSYKEDPIDDFHFKLYGTGNDGYGYNFTILNTADPYKTQDGSEIITSMEITSLVVSADPDSDGDEVKGQEMIKWLYEKYDVN